MASGHSRQAPIVDKWIDRASQTLRDLRVAEVVQLDMQLDNGKVEAYRAKVNISFKYEGGA